MLNPKVPEVSGTFLESICAQSLDEVKNGYHATFQRLSAPTVSLLIHYLTLAKEALKYGVAVAAPGSV